MSKIQTDKKVRVVNYAGVLLDSLHEVRAEDHDKVLDNFTEVLKENGDLGLIKDIEQAFLKLFDDFYKKHAAAEQEDLERIKKFNQYLIGRGDMSGSGGAVFRIDDEEKH